MRFPILVLVIPFLIAVIFFTHPTDASPAANAPVVFQEQGQRRAVIVELFTSEGCSSCPPADAVLETLDQTQPVPGAFVVAMSEHVDYWNYIGWTDPYSSAAYSRRQEGYAHRFGLDSVYTPQIVVGGAAQMVGDSAGRIRNAVSQASKTEDIGITISSIAKDAKGISSVDLRIDSSPSHKSDATVFVSLADNEAVSHVLRGENGGRTLRHVAVVRSLQEVGHLNANGTFHKQIPLTGELAQWQGKRLVAFVQEPGFGTIRGAAVRLLTASDTK